MGPGYSQFPKFQYLETRYSIFPDGPAFFHFDSGKQSKMGPDPLYPYHFAGWCCHHLRICSSLTNSLWSPYFMPLISADRGRNSYKNGETTTASVGRICTERSVGVNVDVNPFEPHILASNLAHAIGHNLGFGHDDMQGSQGSSGESNYYMPMTLVKQVSHQSSLPLR